VLAMRRLAPDGQPHALTAHVFGNATGEPVTSIRALWEAACAAARIEGLHFHDLRREFACQLLESSSALHDVSEFLGHANIATTSTYLKSNAKRLSASIDRLDAAQATPSAATTAATTSDTDSHEIRTTEADPDPGRSEGAAVTH
jgi:integrase